MRLREAQALLESGLPGGGVHRRTKAASLCGGTTVKTPSNFHSVVKCRSLKYVISKDTCTDVLTNLIKSGFPMKRGEMRFLSTKHFPAQTLNSGYKHLTNT